jgi:hypothetical protein
VNGLVNGVVNGLSMRDAPRPEDAIIFAMSKKQIQKRIGPEALARVLGQWNDGEVTTAEAMEALDVSRPQLYRLRTKWLASGKGSSVDVGVSGGDHAADWPKECVEHLAAMLEASGDHGPDYALYADELERLYGFSRDRSNVRKYCEAHMGKLLRRLFPVERQAEPRGRRWQKSRFGELVQHDSTPLRLWGPPEARQSVIMTVDDATRNVLACRVCERETLVEHFAALEQMFAHVGVPQAIYTDGFTMFGKAGEDLKSQFGKVCRAFGILHLVAPTPQAKGKVERYMRTFQHRLAIVFAAQGVGDVNAANEVAFEHYRHWNANHFHKEMGCTLLEARARLEEEGKSLMKAPPDFKVVKLFLSLRERRRVEMGRIVEFDGRRWTISSTQRKYVTIAVRPHDREFYVLEDDLDPTVRGLPRILGKFSY